MSSSKIKIGIDVHGVLDSLPDVFSFLTNAIINSGGEVHILTGGTWNKELEERLGELNIVWTHTFSVYDYLISIDTKTNGEIRFPDGTIQKKFDDKTWDSVKANYCKANSISLHIDDTLIYNDYFTTPFCRLWSHNNKPKASHKDLRHLD